MTSLAFDVRLVFVESIEPFKCANLQKTFQVCKELFVPEGTYIRHVAIVYYSSRSPYREQQSK